MNKALIIVDVQYDFLPGGPLGVPDGDKVIHPLSVLMDKVDIIVFTRDWHPENHISFSTDPQFVDGSWPMHCVSGTPGAEIDELLWWAAIDTGKPILLVHKGDDVDKEAYSGFDGIVVRTWNVPLGADLRDSDLKQAFTYLSVDEVLIGGLALDYCVSATALHSVRDYPTTVYLDATRPVSYRTGAEAVAIMTKLNVRTDARELT